MAGPNRGPEVDFELKERAMDEAPVGITISDPAQEDNPLIYANEAFERLTGYPRETVVGQNCRFLQGPDSSCEAVAEMARGIDAGETVSVEIVNYRADGETFWNEVTIAPLRDEDGVAAAVRAELRRTEERYREGVAGIRYLPRDCRFPVLLSAVLYAEYHRLIRERGYDVLSATPSLEPADYVRVVARTWWYWRTAPDAETAFYRASAVPAPREEDLKSGASAEPSGGFDGDGGPLGRVADALRSRWPVG